MLKFVFFIINICLTISLFSQDKIKTKDFFKDLNKEERRVIIFKGTEPAGSGMYNNHFEHGVYVCKACNNPLFNSTSKFNSNCGWPSFDDEINGSIKRYEDNSFFMKRTEICCANCNGHLGHVFEGENLTKKNLRHCVNSISIRFIKKN